MRCSLAAASRRSGHCATFKLKRDGRLISTLDLYDLLLHGDTSGDHQLLPGDVIFIPPIGNTVAVYGSVRRPAIYELKGEKTAEQVVQLAGGLQPDADASLGQLERILPSHLRQMHNIDLIDHRRPYDFDRQWRQVEGPRDPADAREFGQAQRICVSAGAFAYHPGLRLTDVLQSFDEVRPDADLHYIMIRRVILPTLKTEVVSADLKRALAAPRSAADPELRPRDEIIVFNLSAERARILEPIHPRP